MKQTAMEKTNGLMKESRTSSDDAEGLVDNENRAAKQAGSNRLVLLRALKDAQVAGGEHARAVWRTRQSRDRYRREACDEDTSSWNS